MEQTDISSTQPKWDAEADCCVFGSTKISRVIDLESVPYPFDAIYPDATEEIIRQLAERLPEQHFSDSKTEVHLSFHSYLVRTEHHTILVDMCCGNDKDRPARPVWHMRNGPFLENLSSAGVTREDVDYVMCTHLHADHVGWNTMLDNGEWVPTFPNAQYLFAEKEFDYWQGLHDANPPEPVMYGSFADSVLPVMDTGQAVLVAGDHEVGSGVHLEPAYGHTPGNVVIHVEDGDGHAVLCGDTIHHPVQLIHPEWSTNFCADQDQSRATRLALMNEYAGTDSILLPAHFQAPEYGQLRRDGKAFAISR